ncbi:DUF1292 domain-containing protein [Aneurinibacillus thermoaerophilus]|uniref:DUF1292 domain-containing protein n=1 Tax=Aneurinibacillus thermoaerophilus TaxID=143495 RepID=UPI002E202433|nr:DUF1292 domain-containing protein [Aneurinibacillus thermoaerophilus]
MSRSNSNPVGITISNPELKGKWIDAILLRIFNVGANQYAAIKKEDEHYLLKVVITEGIEELHQIDSDAEFDAVREVYERLNSPPIFPD